MTGDAGMPGQGSFDFATQTSYARRDFALGPCNALAADWIDRWPDWPGKIPGLVIHGPTASGKSHLGEIWRGVSGAKLFNRIDDDSVGAVDNAVPHILLDNPEAGSDDWPEEIFFHLLGRVVDCGGSVLVLSRQPMGMLDWGLADLASRLRGMMAAEITDPDDAVLIAVMHKIADDRGLALAGDLIGYIAPRIERSFIAARTAVEMIDAITLERKKKPGLGLVKEVLDKLAPRLL